MKRSIWSVLVGGTALTAALSPISIPVAAQNPEAWDRAGETVAAMREDEKTILTIGIMPQSFGDDIEVPDDAIPAAGYIHGIPRLGVPALLETDASLGVAWAGGQRGDGATALPSGLAMASSWDPELLREAGAMIGGEARAKGFNVMLAGGANLMRDPRNGRTFEYLAEDPLLTGVLVGNSIAGIQSNNIISTIKHIALNGQETARHFVDVQISDAAARESDLLAFQFGIEIGDPGAVMCAYNRVNGAPACGNNYLLNTVLKDDWGYRGFVMSDWGSVYAVEDALNGLDQQSGSQLDAMRFLDEPLAAAAASDPRYAARLADMNRRVLYAIYDNAVDANPVSPGGTIDLEANALVAQRVAEGGIVLLRNEGNALPLARQANRILVVGGNANIGVLSGAGSSQVHGLGGPVGTVSMVRSDDRFAGFLTQQFQGTAPLQAIREAAPDATVLFRDGAYITDAVAMAGTADVVIVFATKWSSEGFDQPDLSLPYGQDALIAALAAANPNTIVVLETGNPIAMPWLDQTAAVIQAWYPGVRGAQAIASVLFGDINPAGHLPITFPASVEQLPRPHIDGVGLVEPAFVTSAADYGADLRTDYDIEGSDVGYRWFARQGHRPLFPFGFGLSYTSFIHTDLALRQNRAGLLSASFSMTNTGDRAGADVAQVYLTRVNGEVRQRLVGFARRELQPGASSEVELTIDPRLLGEWNGDGWQVAAGNYSFALGESATDLGPEQVIEITEFHLDPAGRRRE